MGRGWMERDAMPTPDARLTGQMVVLLSPRADVSRLGVIARSGRRADRRRRLLSAGWYARRGAIVAVPGWGSYCIRGV